MKMCRKIESMSDEELKQWIQKRVASLEKKAKKENPNYDVIGYYVNDNTEQYELKVDDGNVSFELLLHCFYNNFITKDTKIIFGITYNNLGQAGNYGNYYYIDNDNYLFEFCKFIQDKEIEDENELFDYIFDFLRNYFGRIHLRDRSDLFQMIKKDERHFYPVSKEHSITMFEGLGCAMCSEFSTMAQNIMRFMGLESYLVIGHVKDKRGKVQSHAYNLVSFKNSKTKEKENILLDFSKPVNIYDLDFRKLGESPFIGKLDAIDEQLAQDLVRGDKHLIFDDYGLYIIGDTVASLGFYSQRDYWIDPLVHADDDVKKPKTYAHK